MSKGMMGAAPSRELGINIRILDVRTECAQAQEASREFPKLFQICDLIPLVNGLESLQKCYSLVCEEVGCTR